MIFLSKTIASATLLGAMALAAPSVSAQDSDGLSEIDVSFNITGVSEYRFRGLSLSDFDPAAQGSVEASAGGFTVGAWASSLSNSVTGADTEIDLYGSYGFDLGGGWSANIGGTAYLFAGGNDLDYYEISAGFGYENEDYSAGFGVAYVPTQDNAANTDNIYFFSDVSFGVAENLALSLHAGFEDGAFGDDKIDWSIMAEYSFKAATLSVGYVDTNRSGIGKGAVVGGISVSF
ncbi:MAG: hypothetical protein COB37_01515 [Kordiimonadales bacterium]|nr:MAG: hypothetical protein COB37_01515 [Kordiimonadales bacterium]